MKTVKHMKLTACRLNRWYSGSENQMRLTTWLMTKL